MGPAAPEVRLLIYGNSGSGKTTMARREAASLSVPHLDLDAITWEEPAVRRRLDASLDALRSFIDGHPSWGIEGCYGDLVAAAAPRCTELRLLHPGVEVCVARCRARPHEPAKYPTREAQDANLEMLVGWVRDYETRDDEYGRARREAIFHAFTGKKTLVR